MPILYTLDVKHLKYNLDFHNIYDIIYMNRERKDDE